MYWPEVVDGNYVFNLPWNEAVNKRLIREVEVVAPDSYSRILSKPNDTYHPAKFVDEFKETLSKLPKGKKVIVHAGTFEALKALQRAFYDKAQEPCVLIHDAFIGQEKKNRDLPKGPGRELLASLRFQHVAQTERNTAAKAARIGCTSLNS